MLVDKAEDWEAGTGIAADLVMRDLVPQARFALPLPGFLST